MRSIALAHRVVAAALVDLQAQAALVNRPALALAANLVLAVDLALALAD